jgi:hypothetical protein
MDCQGQKTERFVALHSGRNAPGVFTSLGICL